MITNILAIKNIALNANPDLHMNLQKIKDPDQRPQTTRTTVHKTATERLTDEETILTVTQIHRHRGQKKDKETHKKDAKKHTNKETKKHTNKDTKERQKDRHRDSQKSSEGRE